MNKNSTTLIFKNIPKEIGDLNSLLISYQIPAKDIKPFGRKRALISYGRKSDAEHALKTLKELEFSGKTVDISLFCKNKKENINPVTRKLNKCAQTTDEVSQANKIKPQQISKCVQKLYATEGDLGFDQPPPPYLKYSYPPINKDILDNICISLLSNKRFYTQVLHLMNRMNLDPPFTERKYKFTPPGIPKETGTQTDEVIIKQFETLFESSAKEIIDEIESELESSEDETKGYRPQPALKRKLPPQTEQYKKKARQILQTAQKLSKGSSKKLTKPNLSIKEIFETPGNSTAARTKIELQLKRTQKPVENKETQKPHLNIPLDLNTQKIHVSELEGLSVYKTYQKGEISNKLYIKNLHKDVTVEDLKLIYGRFIQNRNNIKLDIKVMQHGRMKGQAFVTFQSDQVEIAQPIVDQALQNTNGFIMLGKPMVVCYGKQS